MGENRGSQVYESLMKFYGDEHFDVNLHNTELVQVIVHYPYIKMKSSRGFFGELYDQYIRFFLHPNGALLSSFEGVNTTIDSSQYNGENPQTLKYYAENDRSNIYPQSHAHGGSHGSWSGYCRGSGPMLRVEAELRKSFSVPKLEMFFTSLKSYLEWNNYGQIYPTRSNQFAKLRPFSMSDSSFKNLMTKLMAIPNVQQYFRISPDLSVSPGQGLSEVLEKIIGMNKHRAYRDEAGRYVALNPNYENRSIDEEVLKKLKKKYENGRIIINSFNGVPVRPKFLINKKHEEKEPEPVSYLRPEVAERVCRHIQNKLRKKRVSAIQRAQRTGSGSDKRKAATANNGNV